VIDCLLLILWTYPFYYDFLISGAKFSDLFLLPSLDRRTWLLFLPYRVVASGLRLYAAMDLGWNFNAIIAVVLGRGI